MEIGNSKVWGQFGDYVRFLLPYFIASFAVSALYQTFAEVIDFNYSIDLWAWIAIIGVASLIATFRDKEGRVDPRISGLVIIAGVAGAVSLVWAILGNGGDF